MITRGRILVAAFVLMIIAAFTISIIYYNKLTRSEQDVLKEQAKIHTLLQRRHNISTNLARTVRDYAVHEQEIFNHVSNMRRSNLKQEQKENINPVAAQPAAPGEPNAAPAGTSTELAPNAANAGGGPAAVENEKEDVGIIDNILSMLESNDIKLPVNKELAGLLAVAENYPDLKLSENFQSFMLALVETEKAISDQRMTYSDVVNNYTTTLRTFPGRIFALIYGFDSFNYFEADEAAKKFKPVDY